MLKKTLKRAGIGFLLGIAMGNLIAFISVYITSGGTGGPIVARELIDYLGSESAALLLQSFLSGVIGFAGCAGMTFYEIEKWSLLPIMATHLALIFAAFLPVSYVLHWFGTLTELLIISAFMLVSYFITWLVICAIYRAQVKELNELQRSKNKMPENNMLTHEKL